MSYGSLTRSIFHGEATFDFSSCRCAPVLQWSFPDAWYVDARLFGRKRCRYSGLRFSSVPVSVNEGQLQTPIWVWQLHDCEVNPRVTYARGRRGVKRLLPRSET